MLLSEVEIKRLKKAVNSENELMVGLGDWLTHLSLFSDAQIYDILKFVLPTLETFQEGFVLISVADSRFVSITGLNLFWDVQEAEICEKLPVLPLTYLSCDLTALQRRMNHGKQQPAAVG